MYSKINSVRAKQDTWQGCDDPPRSHFTIIKKVSNCQKIKVSFPYVEIENYTRFYIGIKSTLVFPDMGNKIPLIVKQIICFVRRSQWQQPLLCQSG